MLINSDLRQYVICNNAVYHKFRLHSSSPSSFNGRMKANKKFRAVAPLFYIVQKYFRQIIHIFFPDKFTMHQFRIV